MRSGHLYALLILLAGFLSYGLSFTLPVVGGFPGNVVYGYPILSIFIGAAAVVLETGLDRERQVEQQDLVKRLQAIESKIDELLKDRRTSKEN